MGPFDRVQRAARADEPVCDRADVIVCEDFEWGVEAPPSSVWREHGWDDVDNNFFDGTQYPAESNIYFGMGLGGSAGVQYLLRAITEAYLMMPGAVSASGTPYPHLHFADLGGGHDRIHVRWYARWSRNWVWDNIAVKHMYIVGLNPDSTMNWRVPVFLQPGGVIDAEIYGPGYSCNPNDLFLHQNLGNDIYFDGEELDRWHAIEMTVQLNHGDLHDGQVDIWVDGVKRMEQTGVQLRCPDSTVGANDLWMTSYWGGSGSETHPDQYVWYDNIVVSTEHIGVADLSAPCPDGGCDIADAGAEEDAASSPDAAAASDAAAPPDARVPRDAAIGAEPRTPGGACACRAQPSFQPLSASWTALLLACIGARARRRRARSSCK